MPVTDPYYSDIYKYLLDVKQESQVDIVSALQSCNYHLRVAEEIRNEIRTVTSQTERESLFGQWERRIKLAQMASGVTTDVERFKVEDTVLYTQEEVRKLLNSFIGTFIARSQQSNYYTVVDSFLEDWKKTHGT